MSNRWSCGGGKGTKNSYDPQIAKAADAQAATSAKAEQFAEDYYTNVVKPMNEQQMKVANETQGKLGNLYDINAANMQQQSDRYQKYGIPAEDRYYQQAQNYSQPDEYQRQAELAKGDLGVAQDSQRRQLNQQLQSYGIDPSSPAAMSAMSDVALRNTAAQASAMNRARNGAKALGMQLTADAANFGRGGQSGILQFGAGAQGNATGQYGVASGALGAATAAGQSPMSGYGLALQGYGSNLGAYSSLGNTDMQTQAAQQAAMWSGIGSLAGTGAGIYMGGKK